MLVIRWLCFGVLAENDQSRLAYLLPVRGLAFSFAVRVRHRFPGGQSLPRHLSNDLGGNESIYLSKSWSAIKFEL